MAATSASLKEYLKKYQSGADDPAKKKKKRKKEKTNASSIGGGVLVVDEDPVWQKPVQLDEPEDEDSAEEVPQVEEDIEVKRMRRMEAISRKPYHAVNEDGSGWVSVSERPTDSDLSPPRQRRQRFDTPSPERNQGTEEMENADLSPPRQRRRRVDPASPEGRSDDDLLPLRRNRGQSEDADLSPPRRTRWRSEEDSSRREAALDGDLPPLRRKETDLSPPRMRKETKDADLSPPRRRKEPALVKEVRRMGLMSGAEIKSEIEKKKKEEKSRFASMDAARSGKGAEPVFRNKEGKPITREEIMKKQEEEKPKEKKLEWGKGLAQKREAEAKFEELELEKERPFARTRDDPELDKMLKERLRWGDPMAHLVKKNSDFVLEDLGNDEKMKESGFLIPQTVPSHSWIKRGIDCPPNRYGLRPGRHWDGVDRSNGYEKELFKRQNEKIATESEAYLWSVSDM